MEVPSCSRTLILVPVAGSLTPWFGSSSYQYCLVSSNSGCAAWPRMYCGWLLRCSVNESAFFRLNGAS